MIKLENVEVVGWEPTIRGMRNPKNSWHLSDSHMCVGEDICSMVENGDAPAECSGGCTEFCMGERDHDLAMRLVKGGPVHAKYRRMIVVYLDITAPLYWWKEFDTYKVGTVANSCSTMHKIHAKEFTLDDFSYDQLDYPSTCLLKDIIRVLNRHRESFIATNCKQFWWNMIQLLPSSYNQKRTVMLNYEVLVGMYQHRKNHKLDEWKEFCAWIESLPYSEIITGRKEEE